MKILICALQFKGGSIQVVLSIINELRKFPDNEYFIVMSKEVAGQLFINDFFGNFHFYTVKQFTNNRLVNFGKRAKWLTQLEKDIKPDCCISTSGPIYWRSKSPMLMGYNLPAHIYLESPFFKGLPLYRKFRRYWIVRITHRYLFRREASWYFVQTEDVKVRLKKYLKRDNVYTVSNTYSNVFKNFIPFDNKLPDRKENVLRLLTISAYYPHKNLEIINPVLKELFYRGINNVVFVLTLQPDIFNKIFEERYNKNIINVGQIKSIECPSLYNECDIMFLPTLLECFSASYAEAMLMQKPILTTNLGFAHSVCGNAALYFEPMNPKDIADKIEILLNSEDLKEDLIVKGNKQIKQFGTAEKRAKQILELCNNIVKK